ncbi:glutathione S-transferase family protein [Cucumibacter marinus]|uniref:glutathione S-transferase family protein n=1 Tax=Cucumibacter marinus TaxID=1121252 RepID=UPI00040988FB|nr:glutathione S-transferase family protein [Cucumibacter marinus]
MTSQITLWGRKTSANVQKVLWTLAELDLDYVRVDIGGKFGGNDLPDYRAMNPNGLVPALRDGDLIMWESNAIVRYLAASYGKGTLWPESPVERALVDQWADWSCSTFQPAWLNIFLNLVRVPAEKRDQAKVDACVAATVKAFEVMQTQLARTPYLAGDRLTYADIVAGAGLYRWETMEIDRPALPHIEAWHARLKERQAFRDSVEIDYSELRAS